ncbi:NERD domain-containing protein [Radiobacillus kanasensis]|uniref:NERD domain-containing protein n=1 Tax=Radiobacillus kanasensis TaxID=2844358 RepID=UPI001E2E7366|nr:NERD domain-containing protein [Radiobacillus kanasensis]UFU00720.1 NERD domain-containing protein [Radiobacillus kanasensis]
MIVKKRTMPLHIRANRALLRRLDPNHMKKPIIEEDLAKRKAGYDGERSIDYYLSKMPTSQFYIFQDLRLEANSFYFQMDILLLSKSFALIIEIKNISGTLYFDTLSKQFIRRTMEKEEGFRDPLIQLQEQKEQFSNWMQERGCNLPVEGIIAISNPSTIITASKGSEFIFDFVLHFDHLKNKINELEKKHTTTAISASQFFDLNQSLLHSHIPLFPKTPSFFGIPKADIRKGVYCKQCEQFTMGKIYRGWQCSICKLKDQEAYKQAIEDYLLLIEPVITNKMCRDFLGIEKPMTASRLLMNSNLAFEGEHKSRVYYLKDF